MQQTKRWLAMVAGSAICLLGSACGGDDSPSGTGMSTGTTVVAPGTGMMPGGDFGNAMPPPTMPPPTNTMNTGGAAAPMMVPTAGSGAPTMVPMGGGAAPPVAGSTAMPMAGSTAMPMTPVDVSMCPPAPDGSPESAVAALKAINSARLAAGAPCVKMVAEINKAAENHCKYYIDPANDGMCTANPHNEVMGCAGFTGTGPGQRMTAAGYSARFGGGEVMAFLNSPQGSVDTWINSVWHRTPMLDPWTGDMGYGATAGCDVMDFGTSSTTAPNDTVLLYPYDGQVNVPTSFNGMYEGPMPPAPTTGWPSASVITVYGKMLNLTEHVLTKDGDTTPIAHTLMDTNNPEVDAGYKLYLRTTAFLYSDKPFEANTKYRVKIVGTHTGGALNVEWTFTTGTGRGA